MNNEVFPIVGIGASAGGIDAFHGFFKHMPADCGMAFVMILHLPANRKSMLTEILSRWTAMRVVEGTDGLQIEPNCVYVPPPHALVTVSGRRLGLQPAAPDGERLYRPIDQFFDSLGTALRERSVGIVLSGTGSDGALGLKAIKACGGLTIAQGSDGSAPQYPEMPDGAIATGAVDLIAPVEQMASHLMRMRAARKPGSPPKDEQDTESLRLAICDQLRANVGHDFSGYRAQTFLRRVQRRMQVVDARTLQDYATALKETPAEATLLFRDLLIRVTSFFRDAETFAVLQAKVIPRLFEGKNADGTVRVWVPGCATGEEVYSLAMLLREFMDGLRAVPKVQLFATDIDDAAIAAARLGRYPATLLDGLSPERRQRFFTLSHGSYVVTREIRDLCTFSAHNLVRDPPFSMMNLVSCRNLLIYMSTELQARIIPIFHYALATKGILLLGGAESVVQHADLFDTVDKAARIFQRREVRSPDLNLRWSRPSPSWDGSTAPTGSVKQDASRKSGPAPRAGINDEAPEHPDMHDSPNTDRFAALLGSVEPSASIVAELQSALSTTLADLHSLSEDHQTALEELRSANEELHSVNEEMQSTNEELETSKEELQSLNEELHTVNVRLTEKIDELDEANSDLRNLFDSTEIATIFLDRYLIIRSFTPAIGTLYNLIPSDVGRPLSDIASRLQYEGLREDVAFVLSVLEPLERRVVRSDGTAHYIMRILPYREPDSTVSGVLVTFVDVTSIVQAEAALVDADVRKDVFLATLSHELRNPLAPIRTAAQLLQSPALQPEELHRAHAIIARQVGHMSSLLDDLLDVSRITRGAFLLKKEYVDLEALLDEAVEAVQPAIDSKRHTLRVERPAERITLEVDPVRVTQVLTNLLTNASKYTAPGGVITIGARFDANMLVLFVRDNGIGIAPELLAKVFAMFTQVKSEISRSEGGLGIGLALAKGLVELHGGKIEVRSAGLGHGSEFTVSLPRNLIVEPAVDAQHDAVHTPSHLNGGKRILIADDNRDGTETMSMLLMHSGHQVHVAHSGAQALEIAKRVRPQIVVLDIGMPDIDGYEVAKRVRVEAWGKDVTLIAVTGWGQEDDKRRAYAAGFDHHMTKPVDPLDLSRLIDEVPMTDARAGQQT
jgi:two-component system, chemotaxis family, CheB/CheR fusion protein